MAFTICYVWEDTDTKQSEPKFGDHFSEASTIEAAFAETVKYVRGSLARQKYKVDAGRVIIRKMWDVTEYAKYKGRFGKHQKIDDVIRPAIGHHLAGDVHTIDCNELIIRVNKELIKHNQPLPVVGLSQWQVDSAENVIAAIAAGVRICLAELCARFGKTIWAGALAIETGAKITVIASYVLTSFSSFAKDLTSFEQFRNLAVIDSSSDTYQQEVTDALAAGSQVVVFLSMCGSTKRQDRIDFLFALPENRLVFIDEADYGAHTANQADPFIVAKKQQDVVILMTGTNGERAVGNWKIDHYLGTTYAELLMARAGVV